MMMKSSSGKLGKPRPSNMKVNHKITLAARRKIRIRSKVQGTAERPRLSVFRSNKSVYLQVINDEVGKTLAAASSHGMKKAGVKIETAKTVAKELAEKLKKAKVTKLVFDRGSYKYHGRVRAVAETLREQGLEM